MDNLWSNQDAQDCVKQYAADSISEDLALRVYTTRLLGGEPRLVLHGGGNTSVKTEADGSLGRRLAGLVRKGKRLGYGHD